MKAFVQITRKHDLTFLAFIVSEEKSFVEISLNVLKRHNMILIGILKSALNSMISIATYSTEISQANLATLFTEFHICFRISFLRSHRGADFLSDAKMEK